MSLLGSPGALLFKLTRQKLSDSTVNNQLWTLEPSGIDGYFYIKSKLNGLVSIFEMQIDSQVVLFKLTRKKPIVQAGNQIWRLVDAGNGYSWIQSYLNGMVLLITSSVSDNTGTTDEHRPFVTIGYATEPMACS